MPKQKIRKTVACIRSAEGEIARRIKRIIIVLPPMQIVKAGFKLMVPVDQRESLIDFPVIVDLRQVAEPVTESNLPRDGKVGEPRDTSGVRTRNTVLGGEVGLTVVRNHDLFVQP